MRTLRHRLAVEVPTDQVGHDRTAATIADRFAQSVPQLRRVRADDASRRGVAICGSVLRHGSSIGGGLPPRPVPGRVVDIHQSDLLATNDQGGSEMTTSADLNLTQLHAALADYRRHSWYLDQQADGDEDGITGYSDSNTICAPPTAEESVAGHDDVHEIGTVYPVAAARLAVLAVNALPGLLAEIERLSGGGEPRTEWAVLWPGIDKDPTKLHPECGPDAEQYARGVLARNRGTHLYRRTVTAWPDGSTLIGAWTPAEEKP